MKDEDEDDDDDDDDDDEDDEDEDDDENDEDDDDEDDDDDHQAILCQLKHQKSNRFFLSKKSPVFRQAILLAEKVATFLALKPLGV